MDHIQGALEAEASQEQIYYQQLAALFDSEFIFRRALTHRSYLNEHPGLMEDNERLEFLGDAVLDFLVGAWLYNHFPEMAEGQLTRLRAALVGNEHLAVFAHQLHLDQLMLLGKGEEETGGRQRPVLLGSTFEAFIGALYLNKGFNEVTRFVEPLLEGAVGSILDERKDLDAKSLLQEWSQSEGLGAPHYHTVGAYGPDHDKIFDVEVRIGDNVYGKGSGHSKQAAAKQAARNALETLGLS